MTNYETVIDTLNGYVRDSCRETVANGQSQLVLKESGTAAQGRLDKITIEGFTDKFTCFYPDKSAQPIYPFLEDGTPQKACDSIIFTKYNEQHYIIICELKSGTTKGVKKQLTNTLVTVDLLKSLCLNHDQIRLDNWRVRYVVIKGRALKKRKTRPDKVVSGCSPDRPREISVKNDAKIQIGKLCQPTS